MTTNQVLFGVALTVVLAVGSQVLARSLRIPALIVLLPVGFAAGAMTNNVPVRRPFAETLIQLILGLLFISISATVSPASLQHLIAPTLVLVAVLVLVVRPLVAVVCTFHTDLTKGERGFIGWMAPRGIVAAATASTFGATLAADGIGGAAEILPATFLVIVATVTVYALTAAPVARLLRVTRSARTRPLLVGNDPWVVDLAIALQSAGLDVIMWTAPDDQRDRITQAGVELAPQELLATATAQGVKLEDITALLLLTDEDDFNALVATMLRAGGVDGPIYRIAPSPGTHGVVHSFTDGEVLFGTGLSREVIGRRFSHGAKILAQRGDGSPSPDQDLLFRIRTDGQLVPVLNGRTPTAEATDTAILLGPGPPDAPSPPVASLERAPGR